VRIDTKESSHVAAQHEGVKRPLTEAERDWQFGGSCDYQFEIDNHS
jgi:hypothetical protein